MDNDIVHMAKGGKKNMESTWHSNCIYVYYIQCDYISTMPYAMHELIIKTHI